MAQHAHKAGQQPTYSERPQPLNVSGVGQGAEQCTYDSHLPVGLVNTRGESRHGKIDTPTINNSHLPGLLGLKSLTANRTIIDTVHNKLYFVGPSDFDLEAMLPPGTHCFQAELSPSGHMILPCCDYVGAAPSGPASSALQ